MLHMAGADLAVYLRQRLAGLEGRLHRLSRDGAPAAEKLKHKRCTICLAFRYSNWKHPQSKTNRTSLPPPPFVQPQRPSVLSSGQGGGDAFLIQASATLENLKDLSKEGRENFALSNFLQLYTQAVLDITYFEENQLVDKDFPEESSLQKVEELIDALSEPELLVKESSTSQEPLAVLGIELLECLYWRRGALLYMFCHTVKGRQEWLMEKSGLFKKFLNEGVQYLEKMLGFRGSFNANEELWFQDSDAARLLHEGVFSDTHLLAMMYSGEMCYWGLTDFAEEKQQRHSTDLQSTSELYCSSHSKVLDFREIGERMLRKYVAVCEGPLRGHDWDTQNAKLILNYFK